MQMILIVSLSVLLALVPLLMAIFFLILSKPRKVLAVQQEMCKLGAGAPSALSRQFGKMDCPDAPEQKGDLGPVLDFEKLVDRYFSTSTLSVPALLLSVLYLAGFLLCDAYLNLTLIGAQQHWLFPPEFIARSYPVIYAFLGVYLFNLGNMVRRVYLEDLNEQVFWGALNRLLLSMGVAVIFMQFLSDGQNVPIVYFSIGFLANILLQFILDAVVKLLHIAQPKQDDLGLQMIKGINIWKEYRLEEEGIENVQNLATANVLELAIRTHYSLRTLIDWIDQAILLSRLSPAQAKTLSAQAAALSAIDFAAASPAASGNNVVADALASILNVNRDLLANTMNNLYQDQLVRDLWDLWQSGNERASLRPLNQPALSVASPNVELPGPEQTQTAAA